MTVCCVVMTEEGVMRLGGSSRQLMSLEVVIFGPESTHGECLKLLSDLRLLCGRPRREVRCREVVTQDIVGVFSV